MTETDLTYFFREAEEEAKKFRAWYQARQDKIRAFYAGKSWEGITDYKFVDRGGKDEG